MWEDSLQVVGAEPPAISQEEYRARQSRLFSQMRPKDLLIVTAPHESTRSNDVQYPYRSSSEMMYLCGWEDPDAVFCAYNEAGTWKTTLFVQPKDLLKEIWEGRRPGVEGAVENWPVDGAHDHGDLSEIVSTMLINCSRVFVKLGVDPDIDALVETEMKSSSRGKQKWVLDQLALSTHRRKLMN